jgi:hypothetical protein
MHPLRTLIASRPGLSWSTDITEDIATIVTNLTTELMNSGLTESVLGQLAALDWTAELAGLQRAAALGKRRNNERGQVFIFDANQIRSINFGI